MSIKALIWYALGFVTATQLADFMTHDYWVLVTFISGLVARGVGSLLFSLVFGAEVKEVAHWITRNPIIAEFYHHARLYGKRDARHVSLSSRKCINCPLTKSSH